MTRYVALLRGINVGGHNRIKMDALRTAFEELGLRNVRTYIQSGNVLFDSDGEEAVLRRMIEEKIQSAFGFPSSVAIRSSDELRRVVRDLPFPEQSIAEAAAVAQGECLHVAFLPEPPSPAGIDKLASYRTDEDDFAVLGRDVYLLFRTSIRLSKLAANLGKLGVPMTVRNWNTACKLADMAGAAEA